MFSADWLFESSRASTTRECTLYISIFVVPYTLYLLLHDTSVGLYGINAVNFATLTTFPYRFPMFSFPSIFIVYSVIAFGMLELDILIGYTNRTSLHVLQFHAET